MPAMVNEFQKATGITVAMTRKSSGETYAQVKAEAANPQGDIWWGGTGDPHLQAAEEGLTKPISRPCWRSCMTGPSSSMRPAKKRTVGIYLGALGFGYNTELLGRRSCPSRNAGPICSSPNTRARSRSPIRIRRARPTRSSPRWCRSWARTRRSTI